MNTAELWKAIGSRIGFYTKETANSIPAGPGTYAWFLPLWIFEDDVDRLLGLIHSFHLYDPSTVSFSSVVESQAEFNWERLHLTVRRGFHRMGTPDLRARWNRMINDPEQHAAFEEALMEATILMPPLYVGKADDLRQRYDGHVDPGNIDRNSFNARFTTFAVERQLPIRVSDLLFVCIKAKEGHVDLWRRNALNGLLEQFLMRAARPPFSCK